MGAFKGAEGHASKSSESGGVREVRGEWVQCRLEVGGRARKEEERMPLALGEITGVPGGR